MKMSGSENHLNLQFLNHSEVLTDSNDVDFVLPSENRKAVRIRKSTAGLRTVKYEWKDKHILRLISLVEERPGLWDSSSPDYKQSKHEIWRDVLSELGIPEVDVDEAKTKWCSLRVTFKTNLAKMRRNRTSDPDAVGWRYFKKMMFVDNNKWELNENDNSISDDYPDSPQPATSKLQITYPRELRSASVTVTPPAPPKIQHPKATLQIPSTTSVEAVDIHNNGVSSLPENDPNSTFCQHLLSELRTLTDNKARTLRRMLASTMYDFMELYDSEHPLVEQFMYKHDAPPK